jgi:hypothetical protein
MVGHARTTFLCSVALAAFFLKATVALAADVEMPVKAPPPPPPPPSNWSAFLGVTYDFGQVNPQGQAVYKNGDYSLAGGANLTLWRDKNGFFNNWTIGGLGIIDFASGSFGPSDSYWNNFNPNQGGTGMYYILSGNTSLTFAQVWTLTESFYHLSGLAANGSITNPANPTLGTVQPANCTWGSNAPGAQFGCLNLPAWYWNELKLSLNDGALTHWAISFNPYVTWWHNFYPSGLTGELGTTTSVSCFSCNGSGDDAIIGMTPTVNMMPYWHIPVTLTAPTWVTVGPKSFWAGNSGAGPGTGCTPFSAMGTNCSNGNLGLFTTGLTATLALTSIPAQYGHWNLKAGFQWYDVINTALQGDNDVTYGASFGLQSSIWTGFVGLGVGF